MILALAPMQDVTDLAFMRVLHRLGSLPDFFITPYFRSTPTACAYLEQNLRCITENETGVPIWAQIAGNCPNAIVRDIGVLMQYPIAGINLNAGCPSALVNRNHAGAGLLRALPLLRRICAAMRDALPEGAFSIKCRLGWADAEKEYPAILDELRAAHPDQIAVHARTRNQLYSGEAEWGYISHTVREVASWEKPCPVLGNGDVNTPTLASERMQQSSPAGLMIGRAAVRNPFIFRQLKGGDAPTEEEMKHYYSLLIEETGRILFNYHERGHCNRVKKYLQYIYPNLASEEKEHKLRRCTTLAEMEQLLRGHPN